MIKAEAELFDGKSAGSVRVEVQVTSQALELRDAQNVLLGSWPLALIRDENIPTDPNMVFLSLADTNDARLRIADPLMLEAIRARCPKLTKARKGGMKTWSLTAAAAVAVVVACGAFVWFGIPFVAEPVARALPQSVVNDLGKAVEDQMIERFSQNKSKDQAICSASGAQKTLERILAEFSTTVAAGEDARQVTSLIVINSKIANAFALPGGRMVIFSVLLDLAKEPNALIGVLAHEYAHIKEQHATRLMVSNLGMATILSFALGDVSGGAVVASIGQMALGAAYSRDMEEEADQLGVQLMSDLAYDVKPMIPLLKELAKKQPNSPMFELVNTHPGIEQRIEELEKQGDMPFREAMTDAEWAQIKTMCKGSV